MSTSSPFSKQFWFGTVDSRALALYRIIIALILLKTVIIDLTASFLYTDNGVMSRQAAQALSSVKWSILHLNGSTWFYYIFCVVWIIVLLGLLIGYRTRVLLFVNFVFLMSLVSRNIYASNGSDFVILGTFIWLIFAPLGQNYSIDSVLQRWKIFRATGDINQARQKTNTSTYAFPVRMLQIYFVSIYFFSFWQKLLQAPITGSWRNGEALYHIFQITQYITPLGQFLVTALPSELFTVLTYGTLVIELAFPLLMFMPFWQPMMRAIGLLLGAAMHIGIWFLMVIRNFSIVMIGHYVLFFPPRWINWLEAKLSAFDENFIYFANPNSTASLILACALPSTIMVQLQDDSQSLPDDLHIRLDNGLDLQGRQAWVYIISSLPFARVWGWLIQSSFTRRLTWVLFMYMGSQNKENNIQLKISKPTISILLSVIMIMYLLMNNAAVLRLYRPVFVDQFRSVLTINRAVLRQIGLGSTWTMFSEPSNRIAYVKPIGNLTTNERIDLVSGQSATISANYTVFGSGIRFNKWSTEVHQERNILAEWAGYYCRNYNKREYVLEAVDILYYYYFTQDIFIPDEREISRERLGRYRCVNHFDIGE